jgi:hypothetical protein
MGTSSRDARFTPVGDVDAEGMTAKRHGTREGTTDTDPLRETGPIQSETRGRAQVLRMSLTDLRSRGLKVFLRVDFVK